MSFFHLLKFVMNFLKGVASLCLSFGRTGPGFSLQFFQWESFELLQPKVEHPEEKLVPRLV